MSAFWAMHVNCNGRIGKENCTNAKIFGNDVKTLVNCENYHYKKIAKYEYTSWSVMHCLQKPKDAIEHLLARTPIFCNYSFQN